YLGQEIVKICVTKESDIFQARGNSPQSNVFVIRKDLLCSHSRTLNALLDSHMERKVLVEVFSIIELKKEALRLYNARDTNPLLQETAVPAGYVPAWMQYARDYEEEASSLPSDMETNNSTPGNILTLPHEHAAIFGIFVHWLYTGKLAIKKTSIEVEWKHTCLLIYALAERLDIPLLRRKCYQRIVDRCVDAASLPNPEMVGTLLHECFSNSKIRRYFVCVFAHAVKSKTILGYDNITLDIYPVFATEVAKEVLRRLREDSNLSPPAKDEIQQDDSDSDVDSDDWTSGTDYDMGFSDDEDTDSSNSKTSEALEVAQASVSDGSVLGSSVVEPTEEGDQPGDINDGSEVKDEDEEGETMGTTNDTNLKAIRASEPAIRKKELKRKSIWDLADSDETDSDKENHKRGRSLPQVNDLDVEDVGV
ncbi:MAG: hypothetical protein MMC33_007339, partial [Icmadophila ericetorum]|nr:hypothetical protein [Icmadophila ericetorum]